MKKIIGIWFLIFFLFSCEKETTLELQNERPPLLVIEGLLTNEARRHEVKISRPTNRLNDLPENITGATVAITDQENIFLLSEDPENPGTYRTAPDVRGVVGKRYYLYVYYESKEYLAVAYMVPVEPIEPLIIQSCSGDWFEAGIPENGDPYLLEVNFNWENTDQCSGTIPCVAKSLYYHLDNIDVNEFFKPEQEKVCFPPGTSIKIKKYSLTPEHQSFLRSMLSETGWRGGIFDVERANITTNFTEGAVGYFAACTVIADSLVFYP